VIELKETDGEHIIEAIGKCRVVIRNGEVVEVGEPMIRDCPLAKRFAYPVPAITREAVKANIENRIRSFGMCTARREVVDNREFVGFGASELISFGLHAGLLDAAVLVCDGAGTVIATTPELVQGIGGRISGVVKTSPVPGVMDRIEEHGGFVLDRKGGLIDQVKGAVYAESRQFKRIAVTVADPGSAERIRASFPDALVFAVHVTGLTRDEAERLAGASDLVTACASGPIRDIAGKRALVQAGTAVPVFAMTPAGKRLIVEKMAATHDPFLVKTTRLPVLDQAQQPDPLV
jgi:putative methanogenesis marker protein 8